MEKCPEVECDNNCVMWAHITHLLTIFLTLTKDNPCYASEVSLQLSFNRFPHK